MQGKGVIFHARSRFEFESQFGMSWEEESG